MEFLLHNLYYTVRSNIQPEESRRSDHTLVMHTFEKGTCCSHCSRFMKGLFYQGYKCVRCNISTHRECISQLRRCGTVQPPELPPRPPLLPIVNPLTAGIIPDSPTPFLTKVCDAMKNVIWHLKRKNSCMQLYHSVEPDIANLADGKTWESTGHNWATSIQSVFSTTATEQSPFS